MPQLPAFLARHPELELVLSEGDRLVDLIREGVDCAVRVGEPDDSDLILRRLALLPEAVVASPDYLARFGRPEAPGDLQGHRVVAFLSSRRGAPLDLVLRDGASEAAYPLPAALVTTGAETMVAAARSGLGLIQVPRYHVEDDLRAGRLVEVLGDYAPAPSPVVALHPRDRQLSPRLRVFLTWLTERFAAQDASDL